MKWLKNKLLLLTVISLCCATSHSQKLRYEIFLMGNKIGETTIEKRDSGNISHYILRSLSDAKVLFIEKKSAMSTDVLYDQAGKMLSSIFENIKNDEKFFTRSLWQNNKLDINKDGTKSVMPGAISFSSLLLYFTEPKDHQKVFSERLGAFFEMVRQSDGSYTASLDGNTSQYTYKGGKLTELVMKGTLGSVVMKLVP
jgi:hypothetical protein